MEELDGFARRLKELRTCLDMTQSSFAEKIGVTAAALSSYENGQINPSTGVAIRIAQMFNVSVDWLCGLRDEKKLKFRALHADEIECRVASISEKGLALLLYKDARVDQNILDETVGPLNWQRHHTRDNANCIVAIWDDEKKQWIEKEDTGKESFTEAEKGLASDSFKRACFNFGIGRELYTAPFIWIPATSCTIKQGKNGKPACYDRFDVSDIKVEDGRITQLQIVNESKKQKVYEWTANVEKKTQRTAAASKQSASVSPQQTQPATTEQPAESREHIEAARKIALIDLCKKHGINLEAWAQQCGTTVEQLSSENVTNMLLAVKKKHPDD